MFDRTVIVPRMVEHVTHEVTKQVHHHRAPTDDSVKLLKELEEKAQAKVIEAVHVGDTTFECVVHAERDGPSDSVRLVAVFSLNGKKLTAKFEEHIYRFERRAAFEGLRAAIAAEIAQQILAPAIQALDAHSFSTLCGTGKMRRP